MIAVVKRDADTFNPYFASPSGSPLEFADGWQAGNNRTPQNIELAPLNTHVGAVQCCNGCGAVMIGLSPNLHPITRFNGTSWPRSNFLGST